MMVPTSGAGAAAAAASAAKMAICVISVLNDRYAPPRRPDAPFALRGWAANPGLNGTVPPFRNRRRNVLLIRTRRSEYSAIKLFQDGYEHTSIQRNRNPDRNAQSAHCAENAAGARPRTSQGDGRGGLQHLPPSLSRHFSRHAYR